MKAGVFIFLVALTLTTMATQAQSKTPQEAETAVVTAYGGEILSSGLDEYLGRSVYVVRVLLDDSTVRVFQVDADTGEIID